MELPETTILARQMNKEIVGKQICTVEISNPKCLNTSLERFVKAVTGKTVESVENKGKWLFLRLDSGSLILFNSGMGADVVRYKTGEKLPDKHQIRFAFGDKSGFTIRVWWFCYLHLATENTLAEHKLTAKLGVSPLDKKFTLKHFKNVLGNKRGYIKNFLLDQKNLAGIGNVYVQDILFNAKLHPKRKIPSISDDEIKALYNSIKKVLNESVKLGGLAYERDFYGNKGGFGKNQFKVGYKQGGPCPTCGMIIEKIKTGATSSYICPSCQT